MEKSLRGPPAALAMQDKTGLSVFPRPVCIPAVQEEQKIRASAAAASPLSRAHMVKAGGVTIPFGGGPPICMGLVPPRRQQRQPRNWARLYKTSAPPRRRGARRARKQNVPGAKGAEDAEQTQRRPVCPEVPFFLHVDPPSSQPFRSQKYAPSVSPSSRLAWTKLCRRLSRTLPPKTVMERARHRAIKPTCHLRPGSNI